MRRTVTALLVTLCLTAAAACGAVGAGAERPADQRVRVVDPYGADPATEGEPRPGGTLVIGNDRELVGFDPTVQSGNIIAPAVFDLLLRMSPEGEPEPYLAESMETTDGGTTWVMGLREGVRFSDGTPLDAAAVVLNTQRHIDIPTSPAHVYARAITAMRAVDPRTVEFTLTGPQGDFPVVFAQSFNSGTLGMIISPAALARWGDRIGSHPVGAGPFVLTEWIRDNRMQLARNDDYWQEGLPHLDGLEVRPLSDTETRYASIQNGDVDMIYGGYNTELVRAAADPDLREYYGPGNGGFFLYFNVNRPPFDDRRMREAVVRAIDLDALGASQYSGQLIRAGSLFAEDSPYHSQEATDAWPAYDPEEARRLVGEYVADGGVPRFSFRTSRTEVTLGEFVQAQMAAVGIEVTPEFFDLAEFTTRVVQGNDFELASWVSTFDYPYPGVGRLLRSDGNLNYGDYANPEVDALIDRAATTTDEAQRTADYRRIELLTARDVAVGWLARSYLSTITRPEVRGMQRYLSRDTFYATLWLAG